MAFSPVASALAILLLLAVPFLWDDFIAYQLGLYLLYGMVGQGIALCWGKTGFLPLGQAVFFGFGAYLSGYALQADPGWTMAILGMAAGIIIPALFAGIIGLLVFDRQVGSGPYFSLITLAISMLAFQLANSMDWLTGGFNGLTGISGLPGIDSYETLYFVIVITLAFTTGLFSFLARLPFGQLLQAVQENEERVQFFGFQTSRLKALAFAFSGAVAGLAGALYAPHQGIVTPQVIGFQLSAELVILTAVGGRFGFFGPVIGAVAIGFLTSELRDSFRYWEIIIALVFILVVLKMPAGLTGVIGNFLAWAGLKRNKNQTVVRSHTLDERTRAENTKLDFEAVNVQMGPVKILYGLTFSISQPGVYFIIGPNGAGKTSAFNAMTGKLPVRSGRIAWSGASLDNKRPFQAAALGLGRKFQVPSVFPGLTIGQNLDIALWANRLRFRDMFSFQPYRWMAKSLRFQFEQFDFLTRESTAIAGNLSVGQRQMLDFSMTMASDPDLILLDEPCAGLSSAETSLMIDTIAATARQTTATFIIVEHDMQVVERLCDHVIVMQQGAILAQGSLEEIRRNPLVMQAYSGGTK